jgi:hypothetical protein
MGGKGEKGHFVVGFARQMEICVFLEVRLVVSREGKVY